MATRAMFPAGVFSVGGEMMEDEGPSLSELPGNNLPVPQLVMLANAATVVGGAESAVEDGASCDGLAEEKEMVELKTVGCSYSDSEGESDEREEEEQGDAEEEGEAVKDLSKPPEPCAPNTPGAPAAAAAATAKRKSSHATVVESAKKKKPFHCKPCNYQAESEEEFVEHLGTHAVSKRMVLNRVEGRSKAKAAEAGGPVQPSEAGGAEAGGGDMGDSKGVIRCERCGYNTNRYDHYVAHLKHHSKEGEDQRVFKCTLCPYTTVSQYHWRKHLRNHFPSKLHTCDQCSYFSDRKSNYIQHIRKHTGMRPFRCPYCDYSSSQKTHLTRHMRTHSGERPFKCDSCNYLAANQHEVTRHARQVHNGPKPLACPYCQYKTADRSNFKKHVELHLNPRQFHCPLCKYAASKKCNLQYHIKSRHVGCDIPIDVSKVKLRVKKGGEDSADPLGRSKPNKVRSVDDEDDDGDDDDFESDEEECTSKQAPALISLSTRKSGNHAQVVATDVETDRVQRKAKTAAAVKDKGALEGKEKVVRKVTTRQKKVARVSENTKEKCAVEDGPAETPAAPLRSRDAKVKRSPRKKQQPPEEKSRVQDASEATEPEVRDEPANPNGEQVALQRSIEEMKKLQKEKRMEKARKAKQEKDEQKADLKTNKRTQSRRTGARKSEKESEKPAEDVSVGSGPEETPEVDKQVGKVKVGKRKATEALDLSTKHSSAATTTMGFPSPKKFKMSTADTAATKPSSSKVVSQTTEPCPALQVDEVAPSPVKLKKTRKTNKKTPVLQESPVSTKDQQDSVVGDTSTPSPTDVQSSCPEIQRDVTQPPPDTSPEQRPTKPQSAQLHHKTAPQATVPSAPERNSTEAASTSSGSREEKTPCAVTDRPAPPTFRRPGAKAPRPSLELPRPAEEDEGIHSSHEGTSDASDSASEGGSEDSGLNSAGAGSGKMPNDPETPTDEIPTPTELKSHLCVFCDRTFPLEVEYRRHVNRHLVNVYYMDSPAAKAGK
ncbi:unnamed protein product [Lota lota]